jgi:lipooligosaccharide transport system ATP-binding protein
VSHAATPVIQARGLVKRYGKTTVVRGLDLEVPRGACFGLLGPNGAGKTTMIRMILGQTEPDAGELRVLGHLLPGERRRVRARLGVVPQTDNLDADFTVAETLEVYGSYYGIPRAATRRRLDELLGFVELRDRGATRINNLSGGMRRRLSIARALVSDPELLVLDEPTTGLDPQVRHLIWQRLREQRKAGKSILITTHYMEEAERLCDELAILDRGRVIERGRPQDLVRKHVEPLVLEVNAGGADTVSLFDGFACRLETVGDTTYCYAAEVSPLMTHLEKRDDVAVMQRPANLEDVFVKLTGRELRD